METMTAPSPPTRPFSVWFPEVQGDVRDARSGRDWQLRKCYQVRERTWESLR
mgnify:CR=1 FL=1